MSSHQWSAMRCLQSVKIAIIGTVRGRVAPVVSDIRCHSYCNLRTCKSKITFSTWINEGVEATARPTPSVTSYPLQNPNIHQAKVWGNLPCLCVCFSNYWVSPDLACHCHSWHIISAIWRFKISLERMRGVTIENQSNAAKFNPMQSKPNQKKIISAYMSLNFATVRDRYQRGEGIQWRGPGSYS